MQRFRSALTLSSALLIATSAAGAQLRQVATIPSGEMPQAGMCRIWIDGVPANRQPTATDCETARARAPRNARVIYGGNQNGGIYRQDDPRYDPRRGSGNDPRYDPRNGRVNDPRYDPRSRDSRDPRYDPRNADPRYDSRADRARDRWDRKSEKERAKAMRKRDKEWEKGRKHDGRDDEDDDDDDDDRRGRGRDRD